MCCGVCGATFGQIMAQEPGSQGNCDNFLIRELAHVSMVSIFSQLHVRCENDMGICQDGERLHVLQTKLHNNCANICCLRELQAAIDDADLDPKHPQHDAIICEFKNSLHLCLEHLHASVVWCNEHYVVDVHKDDQLQIVQVLSIKHCMVVFQVLEALLVKHMLELGIPAPAGLLQPIKCYK
jgi:hypothetical protein